MTNGVGGEAPHEAAAKRLPPGLAGPPAYQLFRWLREPFRVLEECQSRFGDAFTLRLPGPSFPVVVVASPEAVKDVFALDGKVAHAGKANVVLKPLLGQHSVILLDGAEHARQRRMMMPAFHGERLAAYGRAMTDLAHGEIDHLPIGRPFPISGFLRKVTLQVIVRTVFGVRAVERFTELTDVLSHAIDAAAQPILLLPFMQRNLGPLSPWARFVRYGQRTSDLLRTEIRRGRAEGTAGRDDVLAMFLEARDEEGRLMSEDEVHDELVTLLVAGHETTATAAAWALRWLLPDPLFVERLVAEIATARGEPAAIAKLDLLDWTVREALRLQPVVPLVARVLQERAKIGELVLDAGTAVTCAIYLVHRRPSLYPEPSLFRPERFATFKPASWEWFPFGGGLRRCIGAAFALFEMKMVLAAFLSRVTANLASSHIEPRRRGITLAPSGGLPVVITARRSRQAAAA